MSRGIPILKSHLVVWLGEVVQAGDVLQKHDKLGRQVFEHESMVVGFLQLADMFLRREHERVKFHASAIQCLQRSRF